MTRRIVFSGPFKQEIQDFLTYLKNKQHSLDAIKIYLYNFDQYTIGATKGNILTKELAENWLILRENESRNTLRLRAYSLKIFAKYLNLIGKNAYVIDSKIYQCKSTYIPHIFTDKEINLFFKQINLTVKNNNLFPNNVQQIKLFFKILYCCGLRDSELIRLKYKNIDLENNCIFIEKSKNNIERLIFITEDLTDDLKCYIDKYSNNLSSEYVFFNLKTNKKRQMDNIRIIFRKIIQDCNFDNYIKYRIHDFRHTFAVKNIKNFYENNEDIYALLPILMNYMGHSHIRSTEYYLRFTPDVYASVTKQFELNFENVIPQVESIDINE